MPLPRWLKLCGRGTQACACGLGTLLLWTLWLMLGVTLVVQGFIATAREVPVPGFLLRRLEERLADAGLQATFGEARFDPSGHLVVREVRVSLGELPDPIFSADSVFLRADPWALLVRIVSIDTLQVSGGQLLVPAMFSPSGRTEPVLRNLDVHVRAAESGPGFELSLLTAEAGPLQVQASGPLPQARTADPSARAPAAWLREIAQNYPRWSGLAATRLAQLPPLERGQVALALQPEQVIASLSAAAAELPVDLTHWRSPLRLEGIRAEVTLPWPEDLRPQRAGVRLSIDHVTDQDDVRLDHLFVSLAATRGPAERWQVRRLESRAQTALARGMELQQPLLHLALDQWPTVRGQVATRAFGAEWTAAAQGRADTRSGELSFSGDVTPPLLAWAGARVGRDFTGLLQLATPPRVEGAVQWADQGRPMAADLRLATGPVVARGVSLDQTAGRVRWTPERLVVDDILLRTGASEARGSYTVDPRSRDFRFLLDGQLQPEAINGWFREWWPRFWSRFDFSRAVPAASVDVQGRWREPLRTHVFVAADGHDLRLQGAEFDRVRTRLFVRPAYVDVLEFLGERGGRAARGGFTRTAVMGEPGWRRLTFDVRGNTDLAPAPALFGELGAAIVTPFGFETPPTLHVQGDLERNGDDQPLRSRVNIAGEGTGPWSFHGFPLHDLRFQAQLRDDVLLIEDLAVGFAGGRSTGRVELRGLQTERALAFDLALNDARLGESIRTLETWSAARRGEAPPPVSRFQQRVAPGIMDLSLSAEGRYDDPYSLRGGGNAVISGAELGEINLLGILSTLLRRTMFNFTTLQLDSAQANFDLNGRNLRFNELRLSGARAAIEASGDYRLDTKLLDFNAKVLPFDVSEGFISSTVGAVLTPLSHVLEVRLDGRLDEPNWAFVYGPTSLFRVLTGDDRRLPPADEDVPPPDS